MQDRKSGAKLQGRQLGSAANQPRPAYFTEHYVAPDILRQLMPTAERRPAEGLSPEVLARVRLQLRADDRRNRIMYNAELRYEYKYTQEDEDHLRYLATAGSKRVMEAKK